MRACVKCNIVHLCWSVVTAVCQLASKLVLVSSLSSTTAAAAATRHCRLDQFDAGLRVLAGSKLCLGRQQAVWKGGMCLPTLLFGFELIEVL